VCCYQTVRFDASATNGFGQLGDRTTTDSASPVQVQGIVGPLAIAAGEGTPAR